MPPTLLHKLLDGPSFIFYNLSNGITEDEIKLAYIRGKYLRCCYKIGVIVLTMAHLIIQVLFYFASIVFAKVG